MDLDGQGVAARGLRGYVELVAEAVGVGSEASILQLDDPVGVYLALERCAVSAPGRDLALLWDERHGWALAVERDGSTELRVLGYLGGDLLPAPQVVARFVDRACRGGAVGVAQPSVRPRTDEDLIESLAGYAQRVNVALRGSFSASLAGESMPTTA